MQMRVGRRASRSPWYADAGFCRERLLDLAGPATEHLELLGHCEIFAAMKARTRPAHVIAWMSLAACGFPRPPDLVGLDAGVGLDASDADNALCLGNFVRICVETPTQPLVISEPMTLDTMASPLCVAVRSRGDYCVIAATEMTIFRPIRATGRRPLVLLASGTITTGDTIDVGSHRGMVPETGAGADPASCSVGTLPGTFAEAAGGGAGGSFAGMGGNGGLSGTGTEMAPGGISAAATAAVTELRGGCAGQDGALVLDSGLAGHGGGAVYFIAGNSISLHGDVLAGGEGGGGVTTGGGSGGGAGGMIGFDAPSVTVTGAVVANGGGGGEGASFSSGVRTHPGQDAVSFLPAPGGAGGDDAGGDGGKGAAGAVTGAGQPGGAGTAGPAGEAGGGGGGGGAGVIKAPANANLSTSVSPPATP
jgi:hypothetical protein